VSFDSFLCSCRSRRYCNSDTKGPIDLQPFYCLRNVGAAFACIRSTIIVEDDNLLLIRVGSHRRLFVFRYKDLPEVFASLGVGVF